MRVDSFIEHFHSLHFSNGRCASGRYFQSISSSHDIEAYSALNNSFELTSLIFISHWGHMALIFLWISGSIFHIGWNGNYQLWVTNPIVNLPISHGICDFHFGSAAQEVYSLAGVDSAALLSYSGIYNLLYALGFNSVFQLYEFSVFLQLMALASLLLSRIHYIYVEELICGLGLFSGSTPGLSNPGGFYWPLNAIVACFDSSGYRLNFHTGVLFGVSSIAWSGHLVHLSIPASRGVYISWTSLLYNKSQLSMSCLAYAQWINLSKNVEQGNHIFGAAAPGSSSIITFLGGFKPGSASLYLSDLAHHHLALGVLLVWSSHIYSSIFKGYSIKIRNVGYLNGGLKADTISSLVPSGHSLSLALALSALSCVSGLVASDLYSISPYPYLSYSYITSCMIYVNHVWISCLLMLGCFSHIGIFLVRDFVPSSGSLFKVLRHKSAIISHLSWVCLWLGFHTLGLYVHNDTEVAFGQPENQIVLEPFFAQLIQQISGKTLYGSPYEMLALPLDNKLLGSMILPVGSSDLLAHHSIALALHVTALILVKGSLDSVGSRLMPDKSNFGYGFACDGPGRGGTCDISAWDSFYLSVFWMLNAGSWITFYFHYKQLTLARNVSFQFEESSISLIGWFRDYLWFNSSPLIDSYNSLGSNSLSVWGWIFLAAHLCWATGFMFLISWRGYWQELIDVIIYMHQRTPLVYEIWTPGVYTPVALSIVQARFVGIIHFSVGLIFTYCSFVVGATS